MATTTSKIATMASPQQQMETRFVALMTELFQLDEAEALDFGLYRVIRRHNREVHAFLGQIVVNKETRSLQGSRLAELLDASFEAVGHESQADDKFRLKELEQQLGLKPGMTLEQHTALLAQSVAVFFRDCTAQDSAEWAADKLAQHPADRVYANDPAGLSFEGCDRLEAIESVFALQFKRS